MNKEQELKVWMQAQEGVLVAYSGGVDSAYLAYIANDVLGDLSVAVTGLSPSVSDYQVEAAKRIALEHGINHLLIDTRELDSLDYVRNSEDRCFHCKSELYSRLARLGSRRFQGFQIVDGTNADDLNDHRPGRKAAEDNGVRSPLAELGFSKSDIRQCSEAAGLENWNKPASPCLASRVAYGVPVSIERLSRIEKGESILRNRGFREFRLRHFENTARIEISKTEMSEPDFSQKLDSVSAEIKRLGFGKVTLKLDGFKSGVLNESHNKINEVEI